MVALTLALALAAQQDFPTVYNWSTTFPAGQTKVSKDGVTVMGDDIVLDFQGSRLVARTDVSSNRETFTGTGILVQGCKNVVIKNVTVQGYRFNIKVVDSTNVWIEGCDVGKSRAILMMKDGATVDTFLDLRHSDAWREYGAGVWIEKSKGCAVSSCKASGGTIGVALVDTTGSTVRECDFSFCGGWGLAMARSSGNTVAWNLMDFDNRSWGGGWGGDASAMGVADDCDNNVFVGNSMTHSGDGFFLSNSNDVGPVDPQTGFFTPKGGSDHNVIAFNDGSWAPANAFEGTFSDGNVYYRNIASDSGYGFWLGFSDNSLLIENLVARNRVSGVAIEHGHGTKLEGNEFLKNAESAVHLWASAGKERTPFPSTGIDLVGNTIQDSRWAYRMEGSTDIVVKGDDVQRAEVPVFPTVDRLPVSALERFKASPEWAKFQEIVKTRPKEFKMYPALGLPKGIEWIQPDTYGPLDFRGGLAAWRLESPASLEVFLFDPKTQFVVTGDLAVHKSDDHRLQFADERTAAAGEDEPVAINLALGERKQTVRAVLRTCLWDLKWFAWPGMTYDDSAAWTKLFAARPLKAESSRSLGGDWSGRSPGEGVPASHFALVATTKFKFKPGTYTFNAVSDDGFRLLVDGRPVIDRWNHHGPTPDSATVEMKEGVHDLRVEYCQEDGAAVLRLDWHHVRKT